MQAIPFEEMNTNLYKVNNPNVEDALSKPNPDRSFEF